MYCNNCGHQLPDKTRFCKICGAEQKVFSQTNSEKAPMTQIRPTPIYHVVITRNMTNTIAIVGFILSFFIVIFLPGLVCSIIGYNNAKQGAQYRCLAIAGIVLNSITVAIFLIVFLIILIA